MDQIDVIIAVHRAGLNAVWRMGSAGLLPGALLTADVCFV